MNVFKVGCGHIQWDPTTVDGCTDNISYRIRIFSGDSFKETSRSQRVVLSSTTNSLIFSSSQVPSTRPLRAIVSQLITSVAGLARFCAKNLSHMNTIHLLCSDRNNCVSQVKAMRGNGLLSQNWSGPIIISGK